LITVKERMGPQTPAHLAATFVTPPIPANLRVDQPNPGCCIA
jgi:hypothetical protein